MSGFSKLVPEIVQSSVWMESSDIRIVWIYILAMKDESGFVRGDAERFAHFARVPLESAKEAIRKFTSPDAGSSTPDDNGRRLQAIPGGFLVLNHGKYRADRREYMREYMKSYRKKKAVSEDVNSGVNTVKLTPVSVSASVSASDSCIEGESKGGPLLLDVPPQEPEKEKRKGYGEFGKVKLTDAEYSSLKAKYRDNLDAAIADLDRYLAQKGKTYKDYNAAMCRGSWIWNKHAPVEEPMPTGPVAATLRTTDGDMDITQPKIDEWQAKFPKCDVPGTIVECAAMCAVNPKPRRETMEMVVDKIIWWHNKPTHGRR